MKTVKRHDTEKNRNKGKERRSYLHKIADDLRQHVERKSEDVKERDGDKSRLRIQDVVRIHSHIHSKCSHGNLETDRQTDHSNNNGRQTMVCQFTVEMHSSHQ